MEKISGGINWSFILNYFWSSHSPRWSKGTCSKSRQVCEWLGKPGHTKPKAVVTELQSKKWYWCIPSRYWWSKNPVIWLDEHFVLLLAKQNFVRYGICTEKQRIVRSFISCYFQQSNEWQNWWWQKVMLELMKTQENCVNFPPVLSPFYLFFGKM